MASSQFVGQEYFDSSMHFPGHLNSPDSIHSFDSPLCHSFDGLPRSQPHEQYLLNETIENLNIRCGTHFPSVAHHSQYDWSGRNNNAGVPNRHHYEFSATGDRSQPILPSHGANTFSTCPRSWPHDYDQEVAFPGMAGLETEFPSENSLGLGYGAALASEWNSQRATFNENPVNISNLSISRSPPPMVYADPADLECNPPHLNGDHSPPRDSEMGDDEMVDSLSGSEETVSDEPYAKLIYRALMSVESRSMVLQEIYQWFQANTNKADPNSSGWRNSIRHNLSMNAAFRKTDRRVPGDDTKKTSEWVLEPFAIKEGITPTTRYRVKHNKKCKTEGSRSNRADAGRKGGLSASKRGHKHRLRETSTIAYRSSPLTSTRRQRSPPTPPPSCDMPDTSTPYFLPTYSYRNPDSSNGRGDIFPPCYDEPAVFCAEEQKFYEDPQQLHLYNSFAQ